MPSGSGVVEAIVPTRLGRDFRWLFGATLVNNIGDGIAIAAGPLLIASLTRDPFIVSLALLVQFVPSLLFGVLGGTFADRFDRRRMVIVVDLGRAFVLGVLAVTIATGSVDIAIVLAALFVLATGETFADSASTSLVPRLVRRDDLGIANARMQSAFLLANQLAAPPIGAFLFAVGMALPFATNAICFALGALLISRMATSVGAIATERTTSLRADMVYGVRWLMGNPPMRTLALTMFTFNITFGATLGVMVLYASDRLEMGPVGFGLLSTAAALGGIVGTASFGRLERRFTLAQIMRTGLLIETFTHLVLAITTLPAVALATMVVFGAHEFVWGTTSDTVRQRAVPDALMGRVAGVYRVANVGGLILGIPIGGLLARSFGITAPFWFSFVGSALIVVFLWQRLEAIVHAGDPPADDPVGTP